MNQDPLIAEIRRFRDKYARKHGYSIRAIADDLKKYRVPKSLSPSKRTLSGRKAAI